MNELMDISAEVPQVKREDMFHLLAEQRNLQKKYAELMKQRLARRETHTHTRHIKHAQIQANPQSTDQKSNAQTHTTKTLTNNTVSDDTKHTQLTINVNMDNTSGSDEDNSNDNNTDMKVASVANQYADLIPRRSSVLTHSYTTNKRAFKKNQIAIKDVANALKESTRAISQSLKEHQVIKLSFRVVITLCIILISTFQ